MRTITILAASAALALGMAAGAKAQTTQQPAPQPPAAQPEASPGAPSTAPAIQSINIVDIEELPEATQTQVNDVVAKRGDADLQKLRTSIDATPEVKSALEAKGLTSAHVIAASMGSDGALTLVTKKAS